MDAQISRAGLVSSSFEHAEKVGRARHTHSSCENDPGPGHAYRA